MLSITTSHTFTGPYSQCKKTLAQYSYYVFIQNATVAEGKAKKAITLVKLFLWQ